MINRLRKKFIAVSMLSVIIVLALLMGVINYMNYREITEDADETLTILSENGGKMPSPGDRPGGDIKDPKPGEGNGSHRRMEMIFDTRYYSVTFDESGSVSDSDYDRIAAISEEEALKNAKAVYKSGKTKGFTGNYRYLRTETGSGDVMVLFVDCYRGLGNFRTFLLYSLLVSAIGLAGVFALVVFLSGKVVKPVAESYEKQKQFITDAGHELKTPLTVIDADISVMEMEGEKSEWLDDIKLQTKRLAGLTNELVYLSRMDEGRKLERIEFPLSDMVQEEVQSFSSRAKVEGKELTSDIELGISYSGDQKMIKELISILLDNAVKYSSDDGKIKMTLRKAGTGAEIVCENTVDSMTQDQADRMFDRFYRADSSRNEKSGYGLGLSIAKAVAEAHGGSIKARAQDGKSIAITARI